MSTARLAKFRALCDHRLRRDSSFSIILRQEECLMAETVRGAPRYLEGRVAIGNPRIQAIAVLTTGGVLKKKICDFELFMLVPKASEKSLSTTLNLEASWTEG